MQNLGRTYVLNDEASAAFYRNLVRDGVGSGYALVSALTVGDEVVATLLGIRTGSRYVMIRISNAGEKWSNCSPGRLIIERTMAALHRDGVREFDFSVGNYAYKRRFGVTRLQLIDISTALSWRGWPLALRDHAVGTLRNRPQFDARLRRVFGKPLSHEEN
jgi:CelD/BcsL family acetyltransferase involved in cellulose biosynthesis